MLDERGEGHRPLFAGDTLITGDFWAHTPGTDIERLAATLPWPAEEVGGSVFTILRPMPDPGR